MDYDAWERGILMEFAIVSTRTYAQRLEILRARRKWQTIRIRAERLKHEVAR